MGDSTGRPLDYGMVYFGEPNKDPEFYPINIFYDEDLSVAASQPVRTKGGFLNANGDMIEIYAAEIEYSVKILDQYGRKVFYVGDMRRATTDNSIVLKLNATGAIERTLADKNADFIDIRDFTRPTDADHTAGLQAAAAVALAQKKKLQGSGTYIIKSADVSFRNIQLDLGACKFIVTDPYKIIMGGDAGTTQNPTQIIGDVQNVTASLNYNFTNNPTVRVIGAKNQRIKFGFVQYLQFYQSTNPATYPSDASQAYSTFDIDCAVKISVDTDPAYDNAELVDGAGKGNQWFNENTFNLNRCYGFFMRGSYPHNHNLINGGSFEGNSVIRLESGRKNHFKQMRFEGTKNSIYLGERTQGNIIEKTWYSSEASFWTVPTLTDLGYLNSVRTDYEKQSVKRSVLNLSVTDTVYNNQKDASYGRASSNKYIKSREAKFTMLGMSKVFPILKGDYIFAKLVGEPNTYYTVRVYLYDNDMNIIDNVLSIENETSLTASASGYFTGGISDTATARFSSRDSSVYYAQVQIYSPADLARQTAKQINVFTLSFASSFDNDFKDIGESNTAKTITALPSAFVGNVGDFVRTLGNIAYTCQHMIYTKLSNTASSSSITVATFSVKSTGSSKVGDLVGIELDNKLVHWSSIADISSNDITLAAALPSAAAAGNTVYISRLA